ncbi:MAG: hypothetical protein QOH68_1055 [Nocardioidaceae bacterium]|nr:hypothetical protein [Nocardioidaceae bacterium]
MGAVPAMPAARRVGPDLRVLIPVLIGLVSVSVAVLAWRSSQLNENATDADRAGVTDSAFVTLKELEARAFSTNFEAGDTRLQLLQGEARALRADAEAAATPAAAAPLIARAEELEAQAAQLITLATRVPSDQNLRTPFDVGAQVDRILTGDRELDRHDPEAQLAAGDELRSHSLQLATITVFLALSVLLLTVAQVNRGEILRLSLVFVAAAVWVISMGAAIGIGLS